MKIAIVGPAYPWRGGIAHHTNMLAILLRQKQIELDVITFSRQYPAILYPGKNQKEIDTGGKFADVRSKCILDTLNPISWWRTARYIVKTQPKNCIFKYWHFYFVPVFTFIAWYLKRHNIKVTCIIDHIYSHESHLIDRIGTKIFFSQVTEVIIQSEIDYGIFKQEFPYMPAVFSPLPPYNQFGPKIDRKSARLKLGLPDSARLLLFFGFIRPYKGLDVLLYAISKIKAHLPDLHLAIVGECFGSFRHYQNIIDENDMQEYVTLKISYISNSEIATWFSSADAFMLPYLSAPNSGAMEIAKFYRLPIIASSIPAFLLDDGKNCIQCIDFNNTNALLNALQNSTTSPPGDQTLDDNWNNLIQVISQP